MSKYKYSSSWITNLENHNLWNLYWYQQKLLDNNIFHEERIAEIGVGTKFTYNYLKSKNYNVTSIDIDSDKNPDILLNIVECNPSLLNYDVVLAFNIFEHIPFQEFLDTINKFNEAGVEKLFFSIPLNKKVLFEFKIQIGRYINKEIKIEKRKNKITAKHHHWELEYKGYTKDKLITDINERNYFNEEFFVVRNQAYFFFKKKS